MGKEYDILIIGGGICGMTAALYASRSNISVCIVEENICGGLVNSTHSIENVPSYQEINGMELMAKCRDQIEKYGVDIFEVDAVCAVDFSAPVKSVVTEEGAVFYARSVIIATGRKPLVLPVETEFQNIHYCSICDGTAYKNKNVLLVGGGNSGFDESLYLLSLGINHITIVEALPRCFAAQTTQLKVRQAGNVDILVSTRITNIEKLHTGQGLVHLQNSDTDEMSEVFVDGIFCFIGQKPNTSLFENLLKMDKGYIVASEDMETSLPGIFAAGDVIAKKYRQITTAMSDGTIAALQAERFLRQ